MASQHFTFDFAGDKVASRVDEMRPSAVRNLFTTSRRPDVISLSSGMPDVTLLSEASVRAAADAADRDRVRALQYGKVEGLPETREAICGLLDDLGVAAKPEDLVLTSGAQQALDLVGRTFIDRGDTVIVEAPTYPGALQAFSAYDPHLVTIPLDEHGMRVDVLEERLRELGRGAVKFLYTVPTFQNPTGTTLSHERRHRLLELSHEYDFLVVEDDPYSCLRYEGEPLPPLKALDDDVIYVGTVSKVFAPGMRMGWIVAPRGVLAKVCLVKRGADLCGSSWDQVMVQHYFSDVAWQSNLQDFIRVYHIRRDAMVRALEKYCPDEVSWVCPAGGFFVWVTVPDYVNLDSVLSVALRHGVTYVPGTEFYPTDAEGVNHMRLSFVNVSAEHIHEAVIRLSEVLEYHLALAKAFKTAGRL